MLCTCPWCLLRPVSPVGAAVWLPRQHLLPGCSRPPRRVVAVSPCSCPCICHLCVAPSPFGAQPASTGRGCRSTAGGRGRGDPRADQTPARGPAGARAGVPALQTPACGHVCARACVCVACRVSAPATRHASGMARASGPACQAHRHLRVTFPDATPAWVSLWRTSVWIRKTVSSAAPAAWRPPRGPLQVEIVIRCRAGVGTAAPQGWV